MSEPTAIYRLYDADNRLLYVGISRDVEKRWATHKKTKPWWKEVARKDVVWLKSRTAAFHAEHLAIVEEHPLHNSLHDPQGLYPGVRRPESDKVAKLLPLENDPIAIRLRAAQEAVDVRLTAIYRERQDAVVAAREAGLSKYRIAEVLGVKAPTVDAILKAASNRATG